MKASESTRVRLGELLVQLGLVTPEQVQAALRRQEAAGGRLGTQLVEAGLIGTDQLAMALGRLMGIPPALERHFSQADPAIVNRLTPALAARYMAVPLAASRAGPKRVVVAMATPLDVTMVDELSFALGAPVEPLVAGELVIARHVKRLYGVEVALKSRVRVEQAEVTEAERPCATRGAGHTPVVRAAQPTSPGTPTPLPRRGMSSTPAVAAPGLGLGEAIVRLDAVDHREQVADIVVNYMTGRFGCGLVLLVREGTARVWRGLAPGIPAAAIETIAFPIAMPSCFQIAFEREATFRGPPPAEGMSLQRKIWKYLRCKEPRDILVVPIKIGTRVLGVVYAHALDGGRLPEDGASELPAVCSAAGSAVVRLIQGMRSRAMPSAHPPSHAP